VETVKLLGKNITLRSLYPEDTSCVEKTIIDGGSAGSVVTFAGTEDRNCVLSGFSISHGRAQNGGGICGNGTTATITNNTIFDNHTVWDGGLGGGIYDCDGLIQNNLLEHNFSAGGAALSNCDGQIINCTIIGHSKSAVVECHGVIMNCIIWRNNKTQNPGYGEQIANCSTPSYSVVQGWSGGGVGVLDIDPVFVKPGRWYYTTGPRGMPLWESSDTYYHLRSKAGRWDPNSGNWVQDDVTSPCIDAGDQMSPIGLERFPNGGTVNMGAYGGTTEASKSWFGKPVCETIVAGDINGDCRIDYADLMFMTRRWLTDSTAPLPAPVTNLAPADEAMDVETPVVLTWEPSAGADSYDVYFGRPMSFQTNQVQCSFITEDLKTNRKYWWRIDAVNVHGKTIGERWEFTAGTEAVGTPR
jgi:hypothetical protein